MKNLCLLLLFALAGGSMALSQQSPVPPTPPAHPATVEQITKLVQITHSADRMRSVMHAMVLQQQKNAPQIFPAAFWTDLEAELGKIDWINISIPLYQRYFSEEEANSVIAFYSTPVGQKVLDSSAAMSQELLAKGSELGKEAANRVAAKYQTEIQENIKKQQSTGAGTPPPSSPH